MKTFFIIIGILITPFFDRGNTYVDAHGNRYDQSKGIRIPIYEELPSGCAWTGFMAKVGDDYFYCLDGKWQMFSDSPNYRIDQ